MGNISSENYRVDKDCYDPRFGQIKVYSGKNARYLEKVQTFANDFQTNDYLRVCEKVMHMEHVGLVKLQHYSPLASNQVVIYVEYYETDLKKEVQERAARQEYFHEKEIRYMFETILQAGMYLQSRAVYHGDLRAQNIFITQDGFVKIADHGFINPFKHGPLKTLVFNEHGYISPELLSSLQQGNSHPSIDYFKSDVFTLGLTFLELLTLTSMHSIYNWSTHAIQQDLLHAFVLSTQARYSPQIQDLLRAMLRFAPSQRADFQAARDLLLHQPLARLPQTQTARKNNILQNLNQIITSPQSQYFCPPSQRQPVKLVFDQRGRIGSQHLVRTQQSPSLRQQSPMRQSPSLRPSSPMMRTMTPQKMPSPFQQLIVPAQPPVYCSFGQKHEDKKPPMVMPPMVMPRAFNETKKRSSSFKVDMDKTMIKDTVVSQSNLPHRYNMDDLEARIQKAIQKTQETISKNQDFE